MLSGVQAVITVIEIVGLFTWVRLFIPEKNGLLLKKIIYVVGIILITALTVYQRSIAMYSRYYLLLCILFCSLTCLLRFGYESRYFWLIAFYFETIYCLDLTLCILARYLFNRPDFILRQQHDLKAERIIIYLIARCIVITILFMVYSLKDKLQFLFWEKWIYIIPIFEHLGLLGSDTILDPEKQGTAWFRVKIVFTMYLLLFLILTIFYIINIKKSISELVEMQKKLYAQSYENFTIRRLEKERLLHDMKNHLLVIYGMVQSRQIEQLENYVDKLCESFDAMQEYTGKRLVDYLISEKVAYAEESGVSVYLDCGNLSQSENGQEDMDWTALLGNLWDNAIESCKRCVGEKQIRFCMVQRGNIISIHMENSCPASTQKTGLITLKNPNEMHGIGMRSIRYVISKYHGSFDWECQGEKFMINITMNM